MREHLGFLKMSSVVVKIAAWIFLFFGVLGGVGIILGGVPSKGMADGLITLLFSVFFFFFLYIIAKIADLLTRIINEIHEIKNK